MDERRRFERKSASVRVEISHPAFGTIVGFTGDISDGGVSVVVDSHATPPIGTIVNVRFKKVVDQINEEPVAMRVMHQHRNTVGLMFTTDPTHNILDR